MRGCQKVNNTEEANTRASTPPSPLPLHSSTSSAPSTTVLISPPASKSWKKMACYTLPFPSSASFHVFWGESSSHHFGTGSNTIHGRHIFRRVYYSEFKPRIALPSTPFEKFPHLFFRPSSRTLPPGSGGTGGIQLTSISSCFILYFVGDVVVYARVRLLKVISAADWSVRRGDPGG